MHRPRRGPTLRAVAGAASGAAAVTFGEDVVLLVGVSDGGEAAEADADALADAVALAVADALADAVALALTLALDVALAVALALALALALDDGVGEGSAGADDTFRIARISERFLRRKHAPALPPVPDWACRFCPASMP